MTIGCNRKVDGGAECGAPAEYQLYASHVRADCPAVLDPEDGAMCAAHAAKVRLEFANPTLLIVCVHCHAPYYRLRTLAEAS